MKQKSAYCYECNRRVRAVGKTPNHILHFLLGFVTVGFWWIFVWLPLCFLTMGNYRCNRCGCRV